MSATVPSTPIDYRSAIRVIGFDLDQTLYPKSPEVDAAIQRYIFSKITEHKGVNAEEAASLFKERYREGRGLGGRATLVDLGIPNASDIIQEALEKADIADFLKPNAALVALLADLRGRYGNLNLITSSNRAITLKKLSRLEVPVTLFSHLVTADDASKSDGGAYKLWLSYYLNFSPQQFLYIGDRIKSDYEAPRRLGIEVILVYITPADPEISCPQLASPLELRRLLL